jgi:hypothetical protein
MENKEQLTKNKCSRIHFLVKSFKQHYSTKLAKQTNQLKIGAAGYVFWLSLSNSII